MALSNGGSKSKAAATEAGGSAKWVRVCLKLSNVATVSLSATVGDLAFGALGKRTIRLQEVAESETIYGLMF
jgi:hypothetical protein